MEYGRKTMMMMMMTLYQVEQRVKMTAFLCIFLSKFFIQNPYTITSMISKIESTHDIRKIKL